MASQAPIPPLKRAFAYIFTAIIARLVLLILGLWWIPVEIVHRKKSYIVRYDVFVSYTDRILVSSRGSKAAEKWAPKAGDLIVSNWASWIELVWLAFRLASLFRLGSIPNIADRDFEYADLTQFSSCQSASQSTWTLLRARPHPSPARQVAAQVQAPPPFPPRPPVYRHLRQRSWDSAKYLCYQ